MKFPNRPHLEQTYEQKLALSLTEIGLKVRTVNMLEEAGMLYVHDLIGKSEKDFLAIANFGEKTLDELKVALQDLGFGPKKPEPKRSAPVQKLH